MDLARAVEFIPKDPEWLPKLAVVAAIGFFAVITTPLLIGLVGWAVLLGYQVAILRNVRDRQPYPLPRWDDLGGFLNRGGKVLTAFIIYQLPNLFLGLCSAFIVPTFAQSDLFGVVASFGMICCLLPLLLVYNLFTAPMFALGMARFAEEDNIVVFFQFADLFATVRRNLQPTIYWIVLNVVLVFGVGFIAAIPCIGWCLAPAVSIPIGGHLNAQYADSLETPLAGRPAATYPPARRR
jgi:hypothetical protein